MKTLDARVGVRENQRVGERAKKMERGDTLNIRSIFCGFACGPCPTSYWPALPDLFKESVMYILEGKLFLISIF